MKHSVGTHVDGRYGVICLSALSTAYNKGAAYIQLYLLVAIGVNFYKAARLEPPPHFSNS